MSRTPLPRVLRDKGYGTYQNNPNVSCIHRVLHFCQR
jgi:hypothetical protein